MTPASTSPSNGLIDPLSNLSSANLSNSSSIQYQKLDAGMVSVLDQQLLPADIFLRSVQPLSDEQIQKLSDLGLKINYRGKTQATVMTGELSKNADVAAITNLDYVQRLNASVQMRPLSPF